MEQLELSPDPKTLEEKLETILKHLKNKEREISGGLLPDSQGIDSTIYGPGYWVKSWEWE